jgi:transcriptional regulator with XRE-family HTH domain
MNEYDENFAKRLRDVRNRAKLTQEQLGTELGFKGNTAVYRFESGESSPSIETLCLLAKKLKIDLHWLVTGEISPALKILKPFAQSHLELMAKKMQDLRTEQADIRVKGQFGGMSSLRSEEIAGEIENLRMYSQTVRQVLNEVLGPMNESI